MAAFQSSFSTEGICSTLTYSLQTWGLQESLVSKL